MKSKFGKIWRITMAMALLLALVPVLTVASPVGANPTNGLVCDDIDVTVDPEVVACESTNEQKCFTVCNDGDNGGDIYTFQIDVPVDGAGWPVYEVISYWEGSGWQADVEIHAASGWISKIRWYTSTDPIEPEHCLGFSINVNVPGAGTYTWLWYVWETTQTCVEACDPVDPDCFGEVDQTVDCDDPVVTTECIGLDCPTGVCDTQGGTMGEGDYDVTATITDSSAWAGIDAYLYWSTELCCGDEDTWNEEEMDVTPVNETTVTASATIPEQSDGDTVCYYIEAEDQAEHTGESQCCCFEVDQTAPVLTIDIEGDAECFVPSTDVTFVVTSTEMTYKDDPANGRMETAPTVVVEQPTLADDDITDTAVLIDPLTWRYTFHVNEDCDHTATVSGEDCVGNVADEEEVEFYGDGTGPPAPVLDSEVCPLEIILTWDGVCDDDVHDACQCVDYYIVYRDGVPLDEVVDHTGCGDPHGYIDTGYHLEDGVLYCYEVSAVDCLGNEGPKSNEECQTYTESRPAHEATIDDLCIGWNLISLPKVPVNPATEVILAGVLDNAGDPADPDDGEAVWAYDADPDAVDPWSFLRVTESGFVGDLTQMVDGPGYWLFLLDEGEEITVYGWDMAAGGGAVPPLYDVYPGWNLIGFKSQEAMCPVEYLWRLLVADATGSAIFTMGYDVFNEWWDTWGAASWFAHVEAYGAPGAYPIEEVDWLTWWETTGAAAFDAHVGQYHTSEWAQMQVSLELQFENLLMMLFAYDCDCDFLDYYVPFEMEPGSGYWLYVPDGGEILPIGMEHLFFLQVMGGGIGYCPGGGCS